MKLFAATTRTVAWSFVSLLSWIGLAAATTWAEPTATPVANLKVAKGFKVELLYSVPKEEQGSWVNMCVDPKGRLIVSDQYGSLYRVTPPGILDATELVVEKIDVPIGEAQGLLWAFDSLYVSVNKGQHYEGGLYRVRDTDGDDKLDNVETLRFLKGTGEHGPHAVLPHPDGKSLVVVCGNRTELTEIAGSKVTSWDEDLLLPRVQGKFMRGTRAPGGCIYRIDPDGKAWEVLSSGFRNQYDAAYNLEGELFTYDADMEWDVNTPWYRPTRICHVIDGSEFGWRSGAGKWPTYYADSVPPVVDIGPGSPTGVCFGYGAKFPAKYQQALFACDWSYGKLYAVHLEPEGATYAGKLEEFITGTPLPLTDVVINPHDGAMYFAIGGRRVQSGLYRVTHPSGGHPSVAASQPSSDRKLRRELEAVGPDADQGTIDKVWTHLNSPDRFIRYTARVALERQPVSSWKQRALGEPDVQRKLTALLALARSYRRAEMGEAPDIDSPIPDWDSLDIDPRRSAATTEILEALDRINAGRLTETQVLELFRVLSVTFVRVGPPDAEQRSEILRRLENVLSENNSAAINSEAAQLMAYLQAPYGVEKILPMMESAATQEEQIDYARTLRHLTVGWTPAQRQRYFKWFTRAASYQGGSSFQLFVNNIKADAVAKLSAREKARLKPILTAKPKSDGPVFTAEPRPFVKEWTIDELAPMMENGLRGRDFNNGRKMFAAASCFACHRFDNQGGSVGPDLTALSGRFSTRDVLESVVDPSKQISDQYGSVKILTVDGQVISGRIVNLSGDHLRIQTDMLKPGALTQVNRNDIEQMAESKVSMMPQGLLNTLNREEILDLMAYMLSRGDRNHAMFKN
ncbi:MAG: c-type cytochrome [Pirellulales bacterium]|nr:c-type cytochrome [Pirellulales bacterium]